MVGGGHDRWGLAAGGRLLPVCQWEIVVSPPLGHTPVSSIMPSVQYVPWVGRHYHPCSPISAGKVWPDGGRSSTWHWDCEMEDLLFVGEIVGAGLLKMENNYTYKNSIKGWFCHCVLWPVWLCFMGQATRPGAVNSEARDSQRGNKSEQRRTGGKRLGVVGTGAKGSENSDFITQFWTGVAMLECGVSISTTYSKEAGNWDVYVKFLD